MLSFGRRGIRTIEACFFPSFLGKKKKAWRNGYIKALWNKWEGPGFAGRETVYAAKGLDIPVRRTVMI
jgi:hypothetical protein